MTKEIDWDNPWQIAALLRDNSYQKTSEFREKQRQAQLGKKRSKEHIEILRRIHTGRKVSEETRQKMSIAQTGRVHSEESREKMSASKKGQSLHPNTHKALFGRKLSEESRKKIADSNRGQKRSNETREKLSRPRKGRKFHTPDGVFDSCAAAARHYEITQSSMVKRTHRETTKNDFYFVEKKT